MKKVDNGQAQTRLEKIMAALLGGILAVNGVPLIVGDENLKRVEAKVDQLSKEVSGLNDLVHEVRETNKILRETLDRAADLAAKDSRPQAKPSKY